MNTPETARLQIHHSTGFTYQGLARASYNEVRMTPASANGQSVLRSKITTSPPAVQATYRDYFGTIVTTFDLSVAHEKLVVTADATVDTQSPPPLAAPWSPANYRDADVADQFAEYLVATPRTTLTDDVLNDTRSQFGLLNSHDAVNAVAEHVRRHVEYVAGSTSVTSTADEVWALGSGVCQDMSHVTTALLRSLSIPARYVSGYVLPEPSGALGVEQNGQSHAWVEYFAGSWIPVDPTNGGRVGVHHVLVAVGRDYGDVPPLKGIYQGEPSRALGVEVTFVQVA